MDVFPTLTAIIRELDGSERTLSEKVFGGRWLTIYGDLLLTYEVVEVRDDGDTLVFSPMVEQRKDAA